MGFPMTHATVALARATVRRALLEIADTVDYNTHTNRLTTSTIPTVSVTRNIRIAAKTAGEVARAFAVVVSVTEIASGSVAGTSVSASDDV